MGPASPGGHGGGGDGDEGGDGDGGDGDEEGDGDVDGHGSHPVPSLPRNPSNLSWWPERALAAEMSNLGGNRLKN